MRTPAADAVRRRLASRSVESLLVREAHHLASTGGLEPDTVTPPTAATPKPTDRLRLPPGAPRVRVTIGAGTAAQKTWNLRRPVTLIGSRRKCQIFLQHAEVSKAHCAIINTGRELLLRNLCSDTGTFLNNQPIDLAPLADGDVIQIGPVQIQVAVQVDVNDSDSSDAGTIYQDPTQLPFKASVQRTDTGERCELARSVNIVGRRTGAEVVLDHADVSLAHAMFFPVGGRLAVYDLASRTGTFINGVEEDGISVGTDDCVRVGPFELRVESSVAASPPENEMVEPDADDPSIDGIPDIELLIGAASAEAATASTGEPAAPAQDANVFEAKLASLQTDISQSWDRLAGWQKILDERHARVESLEHEVEKALAAVAERQAEVDAKRDAIEKRTSELAGQDSATSARARTLEQQDAELRRKRDELDLLMQKHEAAGAQFKKRTDELKQQQDHIDAEAGRLRSEARALQRRDDELAARDAEIAVAKKQLEDDRRALEKRSRDLDQRVQSAEGRLVEIETQQSALAEERSRAEARAGGLTAREQAFEQKRQEVEKLAKEAARQRAEADTLLAELTGRRVELQAREARAEQAELELATRSAEIETRQADLSARTAALELREREFQARDDAIVARSAQLDARQQELDATAAKLEQRRKTIAAFEEAFRAARKAFDEPPADGAPTTHAPGGSNGSASKRESRPDRAAAIKARPAAPSPQPQPVAAASTAEPTTRRGWWRR